jgi:hypothetical protein
MFEKQRIASFVLNELTNENCIAIGSLVCQQIAKQLDHAWPTTNTHARKCVSIAIVACTM